MGPPGTMRILRAGAAMSALALSPSSAATQDPGTSGPAPAAAAAAPGAAGYDVPVEYRALPNGLRGVLSRDTTAPIVTVAVYYHIGFRVEPRDRTGFAHLFEHLMFQGSQNLGNGTAASQMGRHGSL